MGIEAVNDEQTFAEPRSELSSALSLADFSATSSEWEFTLRPLLELWSFN